MLRRNTFPNFVQSMILYHLTISRHSNNAKNKKKMIINSDMFVLHEFSIKMVMFAADDKMALSNEFNPNKLKKKQSFTAYFRW